MRLIIGPGPGGGASGDTTAGWLVIFVAIFYAALRPREGEVA